MNWKFSIIKMSVISKAMYRLNISIKISIACRINNSKIYPKKIPNRQSHLEKEEKGKSIMFLDFKLY